MARANISYVVHVLWYFRFAGPNFHRLYTAIGPCTHKRRACRCRTACLPGKSAATWCITSASHNRLDCLGSNAIDLEKGAVGVAVGLAALVTCLQLSFSIPAPRLPGHTCIRYAWNRRAPNHTSIPRSSPPGRTQASAC